MDRKRCATPGCGRFVRQGAAWCRVHGEDEVEAIGVGLEEDEHATAAAEFRRRLDEGDYRRLFDEKLREVIAQAAAERSLADEIGALRVVLARLLLEEDDLAKLVPGVARLTSVTVQAARAQRAIVGEQADGLTEAIAQILAELDGT
ncbi:MAG: hypothetical protein QOF01_4971 [Thermomicrobiales bacterium]|nr:hypothetical protein [Thermomicrobiales bacterium]